MYKVFIKGDDIKLLEVKDDIVHTVIYKGTVQIINPTLDIFLLSGWSEYVIPTQEYVEPIYSNEDIRLLRELAYRDRSDSYFIAYQKYLALGQSDKAAEFKQKWLEEVELIDKEYPYGDNTTVEE